MEGTEIPRITPKEMMKALSRLNSVFPGDMSDEPSHYKARYLRKLAEGSCYRKETSVHWACANHFAHMARSFEVISREQSKFLEYLLQNAEAFHYWLYAK